MWFLNMSGGSMTGSSNLTLILAWRCTSGSFRSCEGAECAPGWGLCERDDGTADVRPAERGDRAHDVIERQRPADDVVEEELPIAVQLDHEGKVSLREQRAASAANEAPVRQQ